MDILRRKLFEWAVLRLLWAPWNLLVGFKHMIQSNENSDVTTLRLIFGTIGAVWLVGGMVIVYHHFEMLYGTIWWSIPFYIMPYVYSAIALKLTLQDWEEYVFSLPPQSNDANT